MDGQETKPEVAAEAAQQLEVKAEGNGNAEASEKPLEQDSQQQDGEPGTAAEPSDEEIIQRLAVLLKSSDLAVTTGEAAAATCCRLMPAAKACARSRCHQPPTVASSRGTTIAGALQRRCFGSSWRSSLA